MVKAYIATALILTLVLSIIVTLFISKVTYAYDNEPNGFRGIKWGTNIETLRGFTRVRADPATEGTDIYVRENDELEVKGIISNGIEYYFWRGRFAGVVVTFSDDNFTMLKEATFFRFGKGTQAFESIEQYWWRGGRTNILLDLDGEVVLDADGNAATRTIVGYLVVGSTKITREQSKYERKKAKEEADKDLEANKDLH